MYAKAVVLSPRTDTTLPLTTFAKCCSPSWMALNSRKRKRRKASEGEHFPRTESDPSMKPHPRVDASEVAETSGDGLPKGRPRRV